jgi:hypothetical protein
MGDSRKESKAITLSLEADPLPPVGRGWIAVVVLSLSLALVVAFLPIDGTVRAAVFGSLLASAVLSVQARRGLLKRTGGGRRTSILVDGKGVWRTRGDGEAACVARWDEPFGVTVLANPSKTRALFAFSSAQRTRVVAVRIDNAPAADAARHCLDRAVPVTDADLDDALGGIGSGLSGKSAALLFAELEMRAAPAIGRVYLFDAGGTQVALEGDKLRARDKLIDLADPLEWRSFTFHEGTLGMGAGAGSASDAPPAAVTLYHATWARQGPTELVLVCPIPAEASSWGIRSADPPPPRELRVAVDRLFMIPLRKALEAAPRISRAGAPPRKSGSDAILT